MTVSRSQLGLLYLIPSGAFLIIFFYLPVWTIFKIAFNVPFNQLLSVFENPLFIIFLNFTILQSISTVILSLVIGVPTAYLLARYRPYGVRYLRTLLTVPFLFPSLVIILGFVILFDEGGWLKLTTNINFNPFSYWGIVIAHTMYNVSVVARISETAFTTEPHEYHEIAKTYGVPWSKRFRTITLPHILSSLKAASLLVFLYSFNSFAVVLLLGEVKLQTIEVMIYTRSRIRFNTADAAILAIFQLLVNLIVILWYSGISFSSVAHGIKTWGKKIYYRFNRSELENDYQTQYRSRVDKTFRQSQGEYPRSNRRIIPTILILLVIIFTWLPAISVLTNTMKLYITASELVISQLNSGYYDRFLGVTSQRVFANTFLFGVVVAGMSVLLSISVIVSIYLFQQKRYIDRFFAVVTILPMATSAITLSFALLSLYGGLNRYNQIIWLFIISSHLLAALPFTFRVVLSSWEHIHPDLLLVAETLGSSHLKSLRYLILPILRPAIIVGLLFAFAISIGEFGATFYLARGDWITLSLAIEKLFSTRLTLLPNLYASTLVIFATVSLYLIERTGRLELKL